jgi:cell wall assembly regulator SMI1
MHKAWANLKKFAAPGVAWTLNSGLEEGVVRRLETKMGCVLPPDLRASFLIHDGQGFLANPGMMVGGGRLLSLSEVALEACRQDKQEGEGGEEGKQEGEEGEGVPRLLASPAVGWKGRRTGGREIGVWFPFRKERGGAQCV